MKERKSGWERPEKNRSLDVKSYQLWIAGRRDAMKRTKGQRRRNGMTGDKPKRRRKRKEGEATEEGNGGRKKEVKGK